MGLEEFIRPEAANFSGYKACKSLDLPEVKATKRVIKLDANENPYGPSPRVPQALGNYQGFQFYPDAEQTEIKSYLEHYTGIPGEHIVAGAGSDQLIEYLFRLFVNSGDEVINFSPTFGMYRFYAELYGAKVVDIPRGADFSIDIDRVKRVISPRTKLIFLANPNNPTGTLVGWDTIKSLLKTGLPIVVDEAYFEFSGETVAPLVLDYPNLFVLRTFSKWAGLAGLRIGYGLFPTGVANYLMHIKDPYAVNSAALLAVKESLNDLEYLRASVEKIIKERERLFTQLKGLNWIVPIPSRANFILCRVMNGDGEAVYKGLESRGILVRYFDQPGLRDCIRISVGRPEDDDILMDALKDIGGGNEGLKP
jgi:histidinol-phosphate aminotransferase